MTNKGLTRFAIISFLLLVLIMWFFVGQTGKNYKTVYHAVPESAGIIIESGNIGLSWEKLTAEPGIWTSLVKHDYFRRVALQISFLDSLFIHKPVLAGKLSELKAALVLLGHEDQYGFVFIAEVGRSLHPLDLIEIAEQRFGNSITLIKRSFRDFDTYLAVDAVKGLQYEFCITDGLFIGSFDKKLLERSLEQLTSGRTLLENPTFSRLRATCNVSLGNNVLIKLDELGKIISKLMIAGADPLINRQLNGMNGWMALDFILSDQSLVLNGYAKASEKDSSFLSQLTGQTNTMPEAFSVLPAGLTGFILTSLNDPEILFGYENKPYLSDSLSWLRGPFLEQLDSEVLLSQMKSDGVEAPVIVFRQNDTQEFQDWLRLYGFVTDNEHWTGDDFIQPLSNLRFFSSFFNGKQNFSATGWGLQTGTYFMVSESREILDRILRLQLQGRTLSNSDNFTNFASHLADASSLMLFLNVRESSSLIDAFMSPSVAAALKADRGLLDDFGGLSFQFSAYDDLLYVNIHLEHNPDYKEESMLEWKTGLEAAATGRPWIIGVPQSNDYIVVVQDVNNSVYLLSAGGNMLRKFQAGSPILGDVGVVRTKRDGDFAVYLNTATQLFLINRNGKSLPGFPVQLSPQATAGVRPLTDADGIVFQFVIPCTDQSLHSFSFSGNTTSGWQFPRTNDIMVVPAEHLVAGGRHYIMITDINGELRITDDYGNIRMNVKSDIQRSANNSFYLNRTNSKGLLMSTDSIGKLFYINSNGLVSKTDFGVFSPDHHFLYDDFDLNNAADFIFVDRNRMVVFDRFKSKLYEQQFSYPVLQKPVFLNIDAKRYIAIHPDKSENIFLISHDHKLILDATLAGENPFSLDAIGKDGRIIMLTYSGEIVSCYRMD